MISTAPQYANVRYLEKYTTEIDKILQKYDERAANFNVPSQTQQVANYSQH
jgi:hypothetical protein